MKCLKFPEKDCDLLTCQTKDKCLWNDQSEPVLDSDADANFHSQKELAKTDFDLACDLYRSYVGKAETREERMRRIQMFRGG